MFLPYMSPPCRHLLESGFAIINATGDGEVGLKGVDQIDVLEHTHVPDAGKTTAP